MSGGGVLSWGVRSCHDFYDPDFVMVEIGEKTELLSVQFAVGVTAGLAGGWNRAGEAVPVVVAHGMGCIAVE